MKRFAAVVATIAILYLIVGCVQINPNSAVECNPAVHCGNWSKCADGKQTRLCAKIASCELEQKCGAVCIPKWNCSDWGECVNGEQSRDCVSIDNCGSDLPLPPMLRVRECVSSSV